MKTVIPWVLTLVLAAGVYFLYTDNKRKDADIVQLQQGQADLETLRAENEELKSHGGRAITGLNETDKNELLRLRGEVPRLQVEVGRLNHLLQSARNSQMTASAPVASDNSGTASTAAPDTNAVANAAAVVVDACRKNLQLIDEAKQKWALENGQAVGSVPSEPELMAYLPGNVMPTCPGGGLYEINAYGGQATCSIPSHNPEPGR